MTDDDRIVLARQIEAAGATIYAPIPAYGGASQVRVSPDDLPLLVSDRDAWIAKACGVTPAQYELYEREERVPRCGAMTKSGHPCRNALASESDPGMFVKLHGNGNCQVHG
ncbi:hypothetical protein [Sphingomonas sp. Leaf242]|uniref:hypothetical protein n=1 Tax=Sphingomonas sp. Leaf242 TaxID=1736304 RepID=UPI000712558C|nr:hypothetical protein [Sphingomonas sp. Leaf242]KQO13299.1 hypothetical protein ASF09_03350 [Sphingomonas sp. Leaf242]